MEWIFPTIEISYFFIPVILIHDGWYLRFSQHLILAYLYENKTYLSTGSKKKIAKTILLEVMSEYWYIYENLVTSIHNWVTDDIQC